MPESRAHKTTANRIAKKYRTAYNPDEGVDVVTRQIAVEVETPGTVSDGMRQLQGHKKPAYIAGANQEAVDEALEKTAGTTIGVMDSQGRIVKRSTRKSR